MITIVAAMLAHALVAPPFAPADFSAFPGDSAAAINSGHVHDPSIVEFGGKFFCFSTSGDGFTVVRSSSDLKSWTVHGPIFTKEPAWLSERYDHKSIWAPDIVVLGDKIRMYYTKSNFGTNKSVIGLAECERFDPARPLEGWVDRGLVIESRPGSEDFNAIDAEVLADDDGRHWMFFGSYWSGVQVVELDPRSGKLKNPQKPDLIHVASNSERGNPVEAPAVLKRDGHYYLFVSYGLAAQGIRSTYRIMVGRSKRVTGPYLDAAGRPMSDGGHLSVLKGSPPMFAPGHNDVLRLSDGRMVMPYHFYDGRHHWVGDMWGLPTLQIRELLWSTDGWPLPGLPLEHDWSQAAASATVHGTWLHQVDFAGVQEVELMEGGKARIGGEAGSWKLDGLELSLTRPDRRGGETTDRLKVAYDGRYYVGRTQGGQVVRGIRKTVK